MLAPKLFASGTCLLYFELMLAPKVLETHVELQPKILEMLAPLIHKSSVELQPRTSGMLAPTDHRSNVELQPKISGIHKMMYPCMVQGRLEETMGLDHICTNTSQGALLALMTL